LARFVKSGSRYLCTLWASDKGSVEIPLNTIGDSAAHLSGKKSKGEKNVPQTYHSRFRFS
jgi:hypothetical protein